MRNIRPHFIILLLVAAFVLTAPKASAEPFAIQVCQDEVPVERTGEMVKISKETKRLSFRFECQPELSKDQSGRSRHKLEGFDANWSEFPGEMSVNVCFYDQAGRRSEQHPFLAVGKSSGWAGSVKESTFTHRRETVTVPQGTDTVMIVIGSAGPPGTEGIILVEELVVSRPPKGNGPSEILLHTTPFLQAGTEPRRRPTWIPDGTRPLMASLMKLHEPESSESAFCIIDNDPSAHAEWHTTMQSSPRVTPGERLIVEWNEVFNNGRGDKAPIYYDHLPPGNYRFRVQQLDILGNPLPAEASVGIVIPAPYWKSPWFWSSCAGIAVVVLGFGTKGWIRVQTRRELDRNRLVEQERRRIARDLHDDLGARIAHITLTSANAESEGSATQASLQKITRMTRELSASLSEVVWVVNPENDHLESLIGFLCRLINGLCEPSPIRCRIDALTAISEHPIPSATRHHFALAVKEAVTNVLKHSNATELLASIRFEAPFLRVTISDNGTGFVQDQACQGNGLGNLQHRMEAVLGKVTVESLKDKGTTICFEVPIL